jgi:beta-galactosidase
VLGLEIHEFLPLRHEETITLSTGSTGTVWAEEITPRSATVISHYLDGPAASRPAITSNSFGSGTAWYVSTKVDWYVSTKVDGGDLTAVLLDAVETAGIEIPPEAAGRAGSGVTQHGDGQLHLSDQPFRGRRRIPGPRT